MIQKDIVIYHGNCADGFGAAWCFWSNGDYDFHAGVYGQEPPDCKDRIVYLVDFSYKKEVVKKICAEASFVYLIDHHASAIIDLAPLSDTTSHEFQKNFQAVTDINKSGAMLAWDFLHNGLSFDEPKVPGQPYYIQPPLLLAHIEDRDLWKFKLPFTREISASLFSYEYTFEGWDTLMNGNQQTLLDMTQAGAAIERKHFKDIAELLKVTKRMMYIAKHFVPVANLPYTFSSDAGNILATAYKEGTAFAACYWDTDDERIFSLRSIKDIGMDVSLIASSYGGGGHKNAAGFKVPRDHALAMV